jgi:hypothetical protein
MVIGVVVVRGRIVGPWRVKKCDVQPESAMTCGILLGGPIVVAVLLAQIVSCVLFSIIVLSITVAMVLAIGSPRRHDFFVALLFLLLLLLLLLKERVLRITLLLPSIMLSIVASSLCPSALRVQVALV